MPSSPSASALLSSLFAKNLAGVFVLKFHPGPFIYYEIDRPVPAGAEAVGGRDAGFSWAGATPAVGGKVSHPCCRRSARSDRRRSALIGTVRRCGREYGRARSWSAAVYCKSIACAPTTLSNRPRRLSARWSLVSGGRGCPPWPTGKRLRPDLALRPQTPDNPRRRARFPGPWASVGHYPA